MASVSSPKKFPRGQPKSYSTCLLYNTKEASQKLKGLSFAACNPKLEKAVISQPDDEEEKKAADETLSIKISDKMLCSLCDVVFISRLEQKSHYKSDWHRYNIKQRLKGKPSITEEQFDEISGNVSSISGSESDSDVESDAGRNPSSADLKSRPKPAGIPSHLATSGNTSTDSESESGPVEDAAQRLPKVYFKTADGELISLYRCVLCHKKWQPSKQIDLLSLTEELPDHMTWALFMAGGGHFAGAIFNKGNLVAHKTFHRYVVRAKRGTAQGSRDSQGNAPKSAGASLRRYNEAALTQDIQDLITSWDEHIKMCDKIFLRAPSFNRKIFFGGKTPPFKKDDTRIRLIPFQTRRPTFNEVRRVYELLASIECYGDESEIQDFIPISPPQVFNAETGQLSIREENQLSPRRRKMKTKYPSASPLTVEDQEASEKNGSDSNIQGPERSRSERPETEGLKGTKSDPTDEKRQIDPGQENLKLALPDHLLEAEHLSSTGTSTASESELVEQMETINLLELKEYTSSKKPKKRKKQGKKRKNSLRCQKSPESNVYEEEKYHLKNNLYTACKIGDVNSLQNLLAIFSVQTLSQSQTESESPCDKNSCDCITESCDNVSEACNQGEFSVISDVKHTDSLENKESFTDNVGIDVSEITYGRTISKTNSCTTDIKKCDPGNSKDKKDCRLTQMDMCVPDTNFNNNSVTVGNKDTVVSEEKSENESVAQTECKQKVLEVNREVFLDSETGADNTINQRTVAKSDINHRTTTTVIDSQTIHNAAEHTSNVIQTNTDDATIDLPKLSENNINSTDLTTEEEIMNATDEKDAGINAANNIDMGPDGSGLPLKMTRTVQLTGNNLSDLSPVVTVGILSETFGDNETTLLHVAAREGHKEIVTLLMTSGADPAIRDRAGLTPYMVSKDKPTRNEFRKFMGKWPDKYDYVKAQIPPPLSEEQENEKKRKEAERKKAQKKQKQERQKEKKVEEAAKEAEEREKNRFLKLSDREKRALAAEKRLLDQASRDGTKTPVLSRCWQCGEDMTGKVPFEYMDYKFCTSKCLQVHRKQKASK